MEANTKEIQTTVTPKEIAIAIDTWTTARQNADATINYLNMGNCFLITRDQFEQWSTVSPSHIHAYPSVFNGTMAFTLIDNVHDAETTIDYNFVYVENYTCGIPAAPGNGDLGEPDITVLEGLTRAFRWQMNKNLWVDRNVGTTNGIFQAFRIPFKDLTVLFGVSTSIERLYVVIGLKLDDTPDLILWNNVQTFSSTTQVMDVALPVPPFGDKQHYQLLVQSPQL